MTFGDPVIETQPRLEEGPENVTTIDDKLTVYREPDLRSEAVKLGAGTTLRLGAVAVFKGRQWVEVGTAEIAGYARGPDLRDHSTLRKIDLKWRKLAFALYVAVVGFISICEGTYILVHGDEHIGPDRITFSKDAGLLHRNPDGSSTYSVGTAAMQHGAEAMFQLVFSSLGVAVFDGLMLFANWIADAYLAGWLSRKILERTVPPGAWQRIVRVDDSLAARGSSQSRLKTSSQPRFQEYPNLQPRSGNAL